ANMAPAAATGQPRVITTACRWLHLAAMDSLALFAPRAATRAQPPQMPGRGSAALGCAHLHMVRLAPAVPGPEVSCGASMTIVLDASRRPRHPEKAHRPDAPALKKPEWIRVKAPISRGYEQTRAIVRANSLHTVCEEAACPNIGECWEKKHATFM